MKNISRYFLLIALLVCSPAWAFDHPAEINRLEGIQKELAGASAKATNPRQERIFASAAAAAGRAADALDPATTVGDKKSIEEKKAALLWTTEAAREGANSAGLAGKLGESLVIEGGMSEAGLKRLKLLFSLLDSAQRAKASSSSGSVEQGMGIRELILAIYSVIDNGFHDFWHSKKSLSWFLYSIGLDYFPRGMISELLDYLEAQGDISAAAKARIMDMIDEYAAKRKGSSGKPVNIKAETDRIRDAVSDEVRRTSAARKEADRRAADAEDAREQKQQDAKDKQTREQKTESPKTRPPEPQLQPEASVPQPAPQLTTVSFTALSGKTEVHRRPVGDLQQIQFYAVDGSRISSGDAAADFDEHMDSFTVTLPDASKVGAILLIGSGGVVSVGLHPERILPEGFSGIAPHDGQVNVQNDVLSETFEVALPDAGGTLGGPIEDYGVTIDGQPLNIVASHGGEIAVGATGVQLNRTGHSDVVIQDRGDVVLSDSVDSWGYSVYTPEVTHVDVWNPITAEVYGLLPNQSVTFRFVSEGGQRIEPDEVTIPAIDAITPVPVARVMVTSEGLQSFQVDVVVE